MNAQQQQPPYSTHAYAPPPHSQPLIMNNNQGLDGSGTINPTTLHTSGASLTAPGIYGQSQAQSQAQSTPRGLKRSRSPDAYASTGPSNQNNAGSGELYYPPPQVSPSTDFGEESVDDGGTAKRKRGRPPKSKVIGAPAGPGSVTVQTSPQLSRLQTAQIPQQMLPQQSPQQQHQLPAQQQYMPQQLVSPTIRQQQPQPSQNVSDAVYNAAPERINPPTFAANTGQVPPTPVPTKPTVIKALPTVRDHTTDQLVEAGDEYMARETDEDGEKKVAANGSLQGSRTYRCRTFTIPERGDKLFMLATECARVLSYRDSYLLFNKNRSLFKIIATQAEKDHLIGQELLPYSYRSRQIAIVTAKSMFRQFGSRVITNGRRVRDDYWEAKAKKQGFTEEDPAGEKRPGAAKNRMAQQEVAAQAAKAQALQQQQAHAAGLYGHDGAALDNHQSQTVQAGLQGPAPLPMISPGPDDANRLKDAVFTAAVPRPRQEITGPPYFDQTRPTFGGMLDSQDNSSGFNRLLTNQRDMRANITGNFFKDARANIQPAIPPGLGPPNNFQPHGMSQAGMPSIHGHAPMTHNGPPPMMSPQQMATMQHNQQQAAHQNQRQTPGRVPSAGGVKPEQLHHPAQGNYGMPQQMWSPQQQHHPHMSPPMHPGQHHPNMPSLPMHQQHTQQQPQYQQPGYSPAQFQQMSQQHMQPGPGPQQWNKPMQHQPQQQTNWGYQGGQS